MFTPSAFGFFDPSGGYLNTAYNLGLSKFKEKNPQGYAIYEQNTQGETINLGDYLLGKDSYKNGIEYYKSLLADTIEKGSEYIKNIDPSTLNSEFIKEVNEVNQQPQEDAMGAIEVEVPKNDKKMDSFELGSKTAEFVAKLASSQLDPNFDIRQLIHGDQHLLEIANHYFAFKKTKQMEEQAISETYNGRVIETKNVFVQDGLFSIYDETGTLEQYDGTKAVRFSSNDKLIQTGFIPPLHGVWMGPMSPNNGFPIDLVDTFSMMHDIEYQKHGWFYKLGDQKYISRCLQNLDRMGFQERLLAQFAIKYFSTVGALFAEIAGSFNPSDDNVENIQTRDDFYTFVNNGGYTESIGQLYQSKPIVHSDRLNFYNGFKYTADKIYSESAQVATLGTSGVSLGNPVQDFINSLIVLDAENI